MVGYRKWHPEEEESVREVRTTRELCPAERMERNPAMGRLLRTGTKTISQKKPNL